MFKLKCMEVMVRDHVKYLSFQLPYIFFHPLNNMIHVEFVYVTSFLGYYSICSVIIAFQFQITSFLDQ